MAHTPKRGFPKVYAGRRRRFLRRLVLNGLAQGAAAFGLAHLLQRALTAARVGEAATTEILAMLSLGFLIFGLRIAEAGDAERVGQHYVKRVRIRLFERIVDGPDAHARGRRFGVPMSRMIGDLNALRNWVSVGIARSLVAVIMVIGLLVTMATIDLQAAAVLALLVGLTLAAMGATAPKLRERVRDARRRRGRLANNLGEKVLARETVRQFGGVRRERRRIRRQSDRLAESLVQRARTAQLLRAAPSALLPMALAALVALAAGAGLPLESMVVAVLVVGLLSASLADLARAFDYRLNFEEGRARIGELLGAAAVDPVEDEGEAKCWPVEVRDVSVPGRLERCSFEAAPGERVQVVGPAAAGKSTLIEVLRGGVAPGTGELRIGPVTLDRERRVDLSRVVQAVSPRAPLLRGSVRSNLEYASTGDDAVFVQSMVEACRLTATTMGLEDGIDTRVEEGGTNLSESLRARVALARAAVARPRVLLVDDPAFVVDSTAREALAAVHELVGATLVVVGPSSSAGDEPGRVWGLGERAEDAPDVEDSGLLHTACARPADPPARIRSIV